MYLVVIDAFSRWPEVIKMSWIDSKNTIEKLREVFARYGLPKLLISDNGRHLCQKNLKTFVRIMEFNTKLLHVNRSVMMLVLSFNIL